MHYKQCLPNDIHYICKVARMQGSPWNVTVKCPTVVWHVPQKDAMNEFAMKNTVTSEQNKVPPKL